jgi:serine/threonine protein kinase
MNATLKKILRGKKACAPASHLWLKKKDGTMTKGAVKIGEGEYGKVYRGCVDDKCEKYIVYKEIKTPSLTDNIPLAKYKNALDTINPKMEYTIAKKLEGFAVPKMYLYKTCDNKDILYSEYIRGQELNKWFETRPTLEATKSVMAQVLYNLYRIQEKYPGFRHHDLHGGNILVRSVPKKDIQIKLKDKKYTISNGGVEAVIIDFGFSVFPRIKNPLINTNNYKNIGISRKSDKFYDLHFFLNTMYGLTIQPHNMTERRVKSLVQSLLSPEYLDRMSEKVKMYRLRGNKSHTIPSFETVLSKPFFTGETALQMVIPVKKSQPRVIIQAPKPITPVNQKAAMARAIAAMKAKPKLVIRRK